MTAPRTLPFPHIGGPCDGVDMPVEVDDQDTPVEHNFVGDFTAPNTMINPSSGIQTSGLMSLYEREEVFGDNGFTYVFRFRGTDVMDQAA